MTATLKSATIHITPGYVVTGGHFVPCATDRYPKGGDRNGLRGEAIEPGPKDAPESDASKSASTLTDPEGAS